MSERAKHTPEPWATDRNLDGRNDYDLLVEDWMNGDSTMVRGGDEGQHDVVDHGAFHSAHDYARAMICVNSCEGIADPEKAIPAMRKALRELVRIIDAAGLENLSRGVELGSVSWYWKASDRVDYAHEALRLAEGSES